MTDPDVKKAAGAAKPQLVLMPPAAEEQCCGVLALGASKYGAWNWRLSGVEFATYVSAIKRHLAAAHRGEWIDPESGLPHVAHIMASCAILLDSDAHDILDRDAVSPERKVSEMIREAVVSSDKSTVDKSDRDCAVGEGDCDHLVPAGLPPLPEGWVYYGKGSLRSPAKGVERRDVLVYGLASKIWLMGTEGKGVGFHYALRKGSAIAKTNGFA